MTSLVLAGSAAAYASPGVRVADNDRDRYGERYDRRTDEGRRESRESYDRWNTSRYARDYRGRWVPIAEWRSAAAPSSQIILRGRGGHFDRLRIEGARGAPVIQKVTVEYMDNNAQVVPMNARLPRGAGEVIRLNNPRPIKRVIVYTEPGYGGSYHVYAG